MFMLGNLLSPSGALGATENMIEKKIPVPVISARELVVMLDAKESVILFDTRTGEEYEKSHIEGAVHVEPNTPTKAFIERYADTIRNKKLVFYCSVGQRSSEFLNRVQQECLDAGAIACYNLRGGIFRWYNEGHPVVDSRGATDNIHGYNPLWGMMVEKRRK